MIAAVNWKSSEETVATVTADGTITAVNEGKTTVTATSGSLTSSVAVTVTTAPNNVDRAIVGNSKAG